MVSAPFSNAPAARPVGHISLMTDTFIANSTVEDLRAVVRALLVTGPPNTASAFNKVARARLLQHGRSHPLPSPSTLFISSSKVHASSDPKTQDIYGQNSQDPIPSPDIDFLLSRARSLFGAGMGIQSLPLLALIIRGTLGLQWEEDGPFIDAMSVVDGDIAQAIQSTREEVASGSAEMNLIEAKAAVDDIASALIESEKESASWGGEYPFQRGLANVEWLQQSNILWKPAPTSGV